MDSFFGGKDPFDDPFFTQPFGGLFGGRNPFDDPFYTGKFDGQSGPRKQITIEELNPEDDGGHGSCQESMPRQPSKDLSVRDSYEYPPGVQSFSFQSVTFGGPNGAYYTSSVGKRTGGDGVFLMEMKEDDRTIGESLHTISKGIRDKGHSVTQKQCSDGRVESLQTLHNLQEDELVGFEENWKVNADKVLPDWSNNFNLLEHTNSAWGAFPNWTGLDWGRWTFPGLEYFENDGIRPDSEPQESSSRGNSKKIVPIE